MMAAAQRFADFYRAIHGRTPFPWQERLARQIAETERWPEQVAVPTGLGKTACLDIAVWWLATQADRDPQQRDGADPHLVGRQPPPLGGLGARACG